MRIVVVAGNGIVFALFFSTLSFLALFSMLLVVRD